MKLFLTLSYLGTNFCGYQIQKDKRTVQGELNSACRSLFGFDCDITGCSRTDSGVHANTFCATVTRHQENCLQTDIDLTKLPLAINAHLPDDISVYKAEWKNEDFHPRYDVKYKEYIYRIYNRQAGDPFESNRAWHYPRVLDSDGVKRMNIAAQSFIGKHDFTSFMAHGSSVSTTVRNVAYADVKKEGDVITFRVAADGFLYNMVRIMTGTLVSVGERRIDPSDIEKIILAKDRSLAGMTAPATGLYLNKVIY